MRLLFDCTHVFDHPHVNSGIQRVVRNVVHNLAGIDPVAGIECAPVILKNDKLYAVTSFTPTRAERLLHAAQSRFDHLRSRYWLFYNALENRLALPRFPRWHFIITAAFRLGYLALLLPFVVLMLLLAPQRIHDRLKNAYERFQGGYWRAHQHLGRRLGFTGLPVLGWMFRQVFVLGSLVFVLPWKLFARIAREDIDASRLSRLEPEQGDVLVLLDSSWNAAFFSQAERLKQQGVGLVAVVYDRIPLTHPGFYDRPLVQMFEEWFAWIVRTADGYIAISQTIAEEVREDVSRRLGEPTASRRWFDHFPLGSELDLARQGDAVSAPLRELFSGQRPVYLMVSTIEPRKNHAYLLDAFEHLWAAEPTTRATLCIVGRIGWKCASLVERIRNHPELGKRLFMFNDLDDAGLEYCYQHSRSLVFPSFVEGFGLPLVEAMQRGLPAMASDIPVFREIGSDFLAYFKLDEPASLARLIQQFEATGQFPAQRPVTEWAWPGWRASTQSLVERIARHTRRAAH